MQYLTSASLPFTNPPPPSHKHVQRTACVQHHLACQGWQTTPDLVVSHFWSPAALGSQLSPQGAANIHVSSIKPKHATMICGAEHRSQLSQFECRQCLHMQLGHSHQKWADADQAAAHLLARTIMRLAAD